MSKNDGDPNTNTWQSMAAPSLIKDGEAGTTKKVRPAKKGQSGQNAPSSNWPY